MAFKIDATYGSQPFEVLSEQDYRVRQQETTAKRVHEMCLVVAPHLYVTADFLKTAYDEMFTAAHKTVYDDMLRVAHQTMHKKVALPLIKPNIDKLEKFLTTVGPKKDVVRFSKQGESAICTIVIGDEMIAQAAAENEAEAEKKAKEATLIQLCSHPIYFSKFLIEMADPTPPNTYTLALSALLEKSDFFDPKKKAETGLRADPQYRVNTLPHFHCKLYLGGNMFYEESGDCKDKRAMREVACRSVYQSLQKEVNQVTSAYVQSIATERVTKMGPWFLAVTGLKQEVFKIVQDYLFGEDSIEYNGMQFLTKQQPIAKTEKKED